MANYVKFMRGTTNAYNKLQIKDDDTLYFLSDNDGKEGSLYLGTKLIAGPDIAGATSLGELSDILLTPGMDYDAILMYDSIEMKWRDYSFDALTFRAASETLKGATGFVPAPDYNERNMFLRGDGTWAAAGAECQIFNNIKTSVDQSHADALAQSTTGFILNKGDLAIVQDFIVDGKYQYTSYVYSGEEWCALSKEYNADSIYLKSNINDLEVSGKTLTEAFELILSQMQNIISTDENTISFDNNILSLKDFGKRFYKYIAANENQPAHYELYEVDDEHPWTAGLEPKVVNDNGALVLGWYEPNPTTIEGMNSTIAALQSDVSSLSTKVNNTYTKKEVEEKIAAAPHLKRKKVNSKEEIDLAAADVDQYIYMIPADTANQDNKYNEYIVIETDGIKSIELVGTWEVDLSDYFTKNDAQIAHITIQNSINELNQRINEVANNSGEINVINSVSAEFSIDDIERKLSLVKVDGSKIVNLTNNNDFNTLSANVNIISTNVNNISSELNDINASIVSIHNNYVLKKIYDEDMLNVWDRLSWHEL